MAPCESTEAPLLGWKRDQPTFTGGTAVDGKNAGVNKLPDVGQIQGIHGTGAGPDPKFARISLQYTDERNRWHELQMTALDALYLLNLLEAWAKGAQIEHLRHPPQK
jgi:hypothetical protein